MLHCECRLRLNLTGPDPSCFADSRSLSGSLWKDRSTCTSNFPGLAKVSRHRCAPRPSDHPQARCHVRAGCQAHAALMYGRPSRWRHCRLCSPPGGDPQVRHKRPSPELSQDRVEAWFPHLSHRLPRWCSSARVRSWAGSRRPCPDCPARAARSPGRSLFRSRAARPCGAAVSRSSPHTRVILFGTQVLLQEFDEVSPYPYERFGWNIVKIKVSLST